MEYGHVRHAIRRYVIRRSACRSLDPRDMGLRSKSSIGAQLTLGDKRCGGASSVLDCHAEFEAVLGFGTGAAAVVAGPGTGKTLVMAERITRILDASMGSSRGDKGQHGHILALTFTQAAARNLSQRVDSSASIDSRNTSGCAYEISTFHAFAYSILNVSTRLTHFPNRMCSYHRLFRTGIRCRTWATRRAICDVKGRTDNFGISGAASFSIEILRPCIWDHAVKPSRTCSVSQIRS